MDCVFVSPGPNSYVETLIPNVMIFGGGTFGRELGHKGGTFKNGISVLIKKNQRTPFLPQPCENTARR